MEVDDNELTYTLERFQVEEVTAIIKRVVDISSSEITLEADNEKLTVILDQYQEQSHLMDPYLEEIITMLFTIVRDPSTPKSAFHQAFKYLYLFTKVRGYKQTIRYFSHEVADLEYVLKLLKDQSPRDYRTWETRYVLLLWLAIICIIPFDLSRLDGTSDIQEENMILNRILDTVLLYFDVSDKSKDAAAYLAAKFLTRPDVKTLKLGDFIGHAIAMLNAADRITMNGMNAIMGLLSILVQIFKHGRREDLLPYASNVFECVVGLGVMDIDNTLIRKLAAKLIQRIGLVFLVPKVATWRYTRGNRSLAQNLVQESINHETNEIEINNHEENEMEEDYDIPEDVENVLEFLISCLKDKDTIVRWTTAKGIGRITGRLPEELADEVVASILELFRYSEVDGAWHGGCLALAELGRRGLLLPSRLNVVVPIILKALKYDERRGSYSVGSHVRDAACYVCWAFARAYEPCQIKPFVVDIATSLLITTVFDREVNCRRAASAAFQENVGRQGTFPYGIDILTTADYFAVGNRQNCYCTLSVFIAKFPEYTKPLIDHLRYVTVSHWDTCIRELTSHALYNLTAVAPDYMKEMVLPYLFEQTSSIDLCTKHGAILCVAEIIHALFNLSIPKNEPFCLPASILDVIKSLVGKLRAANKFKGHSGEVVRVAVCKLIEKMSLSKILIDDDNVLEDWLFVIEDTLPHTIETVQNSAIQALSPFFVQYVQNSQHFGVGEIIQRYSAKLKSQLKFERMGFAMAMGELPSFMVENNTSDIFLALMGCCVVDGDKVNAGIFAEARRNAINSITKVTTTLKINFSILSSYLNDTYSCLMKATEDYTVDSRGDVGAWVREAALAALCNLTFLIVEQNPVLITCDICSKIMCFLVQQASEKIDRTRALAGSLLLQMIHHVPEIPFIPQKEELVKILDQSMIGTLNWAAPADGFKAIIKLLHLKDYQYSILLGMSISAGGLTESLVRASSDSLLEFLSVHQENEQELDSVTQNLLLILQNYQKDDRVIIPMLKMLDILLSAGSLEPYNCVEKSSEFPLKAILIMKCIVQKCGDVKKLLASINVFCGFVPFEGDVQKKALFQLMMFLCHKYPRIRKATAEQLYTTLVTYDNIIADEYFDQVTTNLVEVAWDDALDKIRPIRNQICNWLGVDTPKLKKAGVATQASSTKHDDLDSYKDLVTRQF